MGGGSSSSASSSLYLRKLVLLVLLLVNFSTTSPVARGDPTNILDNNDHKQPWEESLRGLSGCELGEQRPGLAQLKGYLHHFGYLPVPATTTALKDDDYFDRELESALVAFQNFYNLNVTGRMDGATLDLIAMPRCGVPDFGITNSRTSGSNYVATIFGDVGGHRLSLYKLYPGRPRWQKPHLHYAFQSTAGFPYLEVTVSAIFFRAFSKWTDVIPLSISETLPTANNVDISIRFTSIDGPNKTLARAWRPTGGLMEVDDSETWVPVGATTQSGVDLESVAVHEIGHLLGLSHTTEKQAVMYAYLPWDTRKVELGDDDKNGIIDLYGPRKPESN